MASSNIRIKKNDKVKVVTGKDKGKIGKVLRVINKKERVLVENINMVKHHTRPNAQNRQGGIIDREAPIHWSNVMLMCNKCVTPVRIKIQRLDDGNKVRICSKCSEVIDA
ncbi:MAG: 50S ribosomal protein L24 [Desulfobacteraceae bacterium]|jgi:large subunit ribosomal protein L24